MSESKFTPGPWISETNQWGETSVKSANESDIAEWPVEYFIAEKVGGHVRGEDFTDFSEVHANAKLIAAAPCLLAAMQAFERISDIWLPVTASEEHEGEMTALHQARNDMLIAIAKATA